VTATADQVLAVAASQIGFYATPGTSSKYGAWYGLANGQWCAMFVSWCANQAGAADVIPKHAYCPSGVNWYKAHGEWHDGIAGIARGDEVYFNFPGLPDRISHTGLVESISADGNVNTIEGNTSGSSGGSQRNGGVCARKCRRQYIVGYGRPAYGTSVTPVVHVVTSNLLEVDGDFGPLTCKALQRVLGVTVDGLFGPQTKVALQRKLGVKADGSFGPISVRALQTRLGVGRDGSWGPITTRALQGRLNAGSF